MDITTLGLAVDSRPVAAAATALDKLTEAGARAESGTKRSMDGVTNAIKQTTSATKEQADAYQRQQAAAQRYLQTLQDEVNTYGKSRAQVEAYRAAMAGLTSEQQKHAAALGGQLDQMRAQQSQMSLLATAAKGLGAAMAGAFVVREIVQVTSALYEASAAGQRLRTTLDFASGGQGGREMFYVTGLAHDLGLQLKTTAAAYASLSAAARGTSLEGEGARKIFESVSKASSVMGLTAEQSSGALLALQQMISKGTVQSEELRGQLGERLPGAFQIAARAMGVTTGELGKMLETGQVLASDFLPKFAAQLENELGGAADKAAERLDAAVNKFDNAWERLKRNVGDSGVASAASGQLGVLNDALDGVSERMEVARASGSGFFGQLAAGAGGVLNFVNPLNAFSYSASTLAGKLQQAEENLKAVEAAGGSRGGSLMLVQQYAAAQSLVRELKAAKAAQDDLLRGSTGAQDAATAGANAQKREAARAAEEKAARDAYLNADIRQTKLQQKEEAYAKARAANAKMVAAAEGDTAAQLRLQEALKVELKNLDDKYKDKGAAQSIKQEQTAYAGLIASIKEKIAQNDEELRYSGKLTEADKLRIKLTAELDAGAKTLTATHKATALALLEKLDAQEREKVATKNNIALYQEQVQAQEEMNAAYVAESKAREAGRAGVAAYANGIEESHRQMQLELSLMGQSSQARATALAQYKIELELKKQIAAIDANSGFDESQRIEERAKARAAAAIAMADAANAAAIDEWEKTVTKYDDIFRQGFADMLNNGKDGWKSFTKSLLTTFKTTVADQIYKMFAQPFIANIIGNLMGITGGGGALGVAGGAGGGSGIIGTASNAFSIYRAGSQAYTLGSQYLAGTMSGANVLGTAYANGVGGGLDALLATNGAYGTAGGGTAAAGSGAGSGMGAFGVYAAVAALIANAVGAFAERTRADSGISGTLGKGDLAAFDTWRTGGTLFKGPSYDYRNPVEMIAAYEKQLADAKANGNASEEYLFQMQAEIDSLKKTYGDMIAQTKTQSDSIQAAYDALRNNVGDMADILGISSDSVRKFTMSLGTDIINSDSGAVGMSFKGLTEEEIAKKISEALATANNTLAEQIIGTWETVTRTYTERIDNPSNSGGENGGTFDPTFETRTETTRRYVESQYAREGEKAIDTLTRLATSLSTVNSIWDLLGYTMIDASLAGGAAASSIADAFGGLESMAKNFSSFYQNFYTEDERKAKARESLSKQLATAGMTDINFDDPNARAKYRKAVEDAVARAQAQAVARTGLGDSLAALSKGGTSITASSVSAALAGFGGGTATPEALQGLANSIASLGASSKGLDEIRGSIADYIETNAEALGLSDDAGKTAAALVGLSDEFAALTQSAEENAARLKEIAEKRYDLEYQLLVAEGKTREALDLQRAKENAALMALDPELAKMAYRLWLLQDAAQANADALQAEADARQAEADARDKAESAREEAYSMLEKAADAERTVWEKQLSDAEDKATKLGSVLDVVKSSIDNLLGLNSGGLQMQAAAGLAFIAQAASSGTAPDSTKLSEAVNAATGGLTNENYATRLQADRERARVAAQLAIIGASGKAQLTAAEQAAANAQEQIDQIDKTLEYWRKQIDIANGTYQAVLTIGQAASLIAASLAPTGGKPTTNSKAPIQEKPTAAFGGGAGGSVATESEFKRPVGLGTSVGYSPVTDAAEIEKLRALNPVYHSFDGTGNLIGLRDAMVANGGTMRDLEALSGFFYNDWVKAYAAIGIPAFEVGTNYVPNDGLAYLHEGEAVVPKAYNPAAGGAGANDEIVSELVKLRGRLELIEANTRAGAVHGNTTARILTRMTPENDAIQVRVVTP